MKLLFKDKKLRQICENPDIAKARRGLQIGTILTQRINELRAAPTLADIQKLPAARLHMLKGDRSGEFAVDLKHPFRLVFAAVPYETDIKIDMSNLEIVEVIRIEEITDYHGKQKKR